MSSLQSDCSDTMKFSISCFDVPAKLLDKNVAKHYFQQYGQVSRIRLRSKQKYCIVEYLAKESAVRALTESGEYDGVSFRVAWTKQKSSGEKKKIRKKLINTEWPVDSEIQAELDAMRGYAPSRDFAPRAEPTETPESSKKPQNIKKLRQKKVEKPKTKPDVVASMSFNEPDLELLKIIMNSASNSEEKFRILDARDKLTRSRTVRQSELSRATRTLGTCPDMCPEKERLMREAQHQVATYEQLSAHKGSMNHNLAVKQYSRSSADQEAPLPHELRPVKVLVRTMSYLLHKIMDFSQGGDTNLGEWYHFVWDRTRGIRKDITQQELCCLESVRLVEQCARFHVFCAARLVGEDISVFDDKINTENLTKCLQTLKYMYHDLKVKHRVLCPNEAEFRAYIVLLNLNDGNFMWEIKQLDLNIQQSPQIKFAIQIYSALDKNNYVRFFKLVKSTTYLNACILLRYFNQVRSRALITILKSYSPRLPCTPFPILELHRILAFEDLQNTTDFVEYYGLGLNPEKSQVLLNKRMFRQPDLPFGQERAVNVVESKQGCSVGEVVCGAPLPPTDFEKHVPHNSFDENGFLKVEELSTEFQSKYLEFLGKYSVKNVQEEKNIDEVEEQEDYIEEPPAINENSTVPVLSLLTPNNLDKISSESPLTTIQDENKEIINTFWSKPPETQFNFTKNIFGTIQPILKTTEPTFKPIVTTATFNFVNTVSNPISINSKPIESIKKVEKKVKPNEEVQQKQQAELMIKRAEAREAKLRMEQKLREEEQFKREQEAAEHDAKIKFDVNIVLQNVLNKLEEQLVRTRLNEISENIKKRRALQFLKRWRNLTRISRKKRKNFFDSPAWLSTKSVSSEAEELYTPSQTLTLHDIKRYKRGTPNTIVINTEKTLHPIDIYKIVYKILFDKLYTAENSLNLNFFWNIGVYFRGKQDNAGTNHLFTLLKDVFDWRESLIVKRCYANNGGSLTYCVKECEFSGFDRLNGLIYIILGGVNSTNFSCLTTILNNSGPMPVVVIIKDCSNCNKNVVIQKLKLNTLIEDYEIYFCTDNNLDSTLIDSLKFLARHTHSIPNLQMDTLPSFLRNCVGEEFWLKINSSCELNQRLEILFRQPNIAIEIYNESLRKSLNIIFDSSVLSQPSFPFEFKQFVEQHQILLPCTYEYFPDYWNRTNYLNKVKKSVEAFFLPKFNFAWPPKDQCDLQNILERFCEEIFNDSTNIILKLLSFFLDKIDLTSDFQQQMSLVSWGHVIKIIVQEKLRNTQFFDKSHAVYTVVYKPEELKRLRNIPWWYTSEIIKNKIKLIELEEYDEPEKITDVSNGEIEIEELKEDDNLEENNKLREDFNDLNNLLTDLEESMEIQQKIMNKFHQTITGTFNFK